jgi:hypothetical protein
MKDLDSRLEQHQAAAEVGGAPGLVFAICSGLTLCCVLRVKALLLRCGFRV